LCGVPVKVEGPDGLVATGALTTFEATSNESDAITLKAPRQVGEHAWTIVFEPHESGNFRHARSSLPVTIRTIAHATSLAVWDVPSPVVMGSSCSIKVGAKSAADCALKDAEIEVCDESGAVAARRRLGDAPWPGTSALYWTTVELTAPDHEGPAVWSV